ncbi:MAG TPA: hypothetical protein DIU20_00070 [Cryomorphaceae bacterium]|nr:hypothetical protein [Cryomorphaceae bacterium]
MKGFVKRAYPIVFVIGAWFGIQTRAFSQSYNPYHLVQLSVESPDLALAKANQALELYEEPVAERNYALLCKGLVFTMNKVTPYAVKYLDMAREAFEDSGDRYGLAYTFYAYAILKNEAASKGHFDSAIAVVPDSALQLRIRLLRAAAGFYSRDLDLEKAEDLLQKSIMLALEMGDSILIAHQYMHLLDHYLTHHQWDQLKATEVYLKDSFQGKKFVFLNQELRYAHAYKLVESSKFGPARRELMDLLQPFNEPEYLYKIHQLIKRIAIVTNNYQDAIFHYKKADSLRLAGEEQVQNSLSLMETEHESKLKEERLDFLKSSAETDFYTRVALILLIGLTFILGLNIYYFQRKRIVSLKQIRINEQNQAEVERKMLESKLKHERLMRSDLDQEVQNVKGELQDFSENFIRNDQLLHDLRAKFRKLRRNVSDPGQKEELDELSLYLQQSLNHDPSRRAFVENALKMDDEFLFKLQSRFPQLTEQDIHLLVFIMLGVSSKELAGIYNIEPASIMTKRYRLRKKLEMDNDQTFEDFIQENL